ncbi:DUF5004 domain-containing protein [Flavivirga eckloniae]|uniref:DUF5004 domain-containing protein n=1 Tax=Flavivirga eckloniae TaxID=1803846 RepID=A0A2K9PSM5_9FLAO|nr:DUF5004 domain-containing protein [Flavivirga eckloniae]AUP80064.1 DUF5004 domain-containing protein [Flavivirga eckloniae]
MKKTYALMSSLIVITLLFVSCSDDDPKCIEDLTGELSNSETAFAHKWDLAEIVSEKEIDLTDDNVDNPSKNLYEQYSECQKDAFFNFKSDRSYTSEQGTTASNCSNKRTSTGTWKLVDNTILTLVDFCSSRTISIELNEDKTAFFTEEDFIFTDVKGNRITSKIKFTYNKVVSN